MELKIYKVRVGKPIPALCHSSVNKICVFFFGTEKQDLYFCSNNKNVVSSDETALINDSEDAVYSAQYKAYPAKQGETDVKEIVYHSVITTKPVLSLSYDF